MYNCFRMFCIILINVWCFIGMVDCIIYGLGCLSCGKDIVMGLLGLSIGLSAFITQTLAFCKYFL